MPDIKTKPAEKEVGTATPLGDVLAHIRRSKRLQDFEDFLGGVLSPDYPNLSAAAATVPAVAGSILYPESAWEAMPAPPLAKLFPKLAAHMQKTERSIPKAQSYADTLFDSGIQSKDKLGNRLIEGIKAGAFDKPPISLRDEATEAASPYANPGIYSRFKNDQFDTRDFEDLREKIQKDPDLDDVMRLKYLRKVDEMEQMLPRVKEFQSLIQHDRPWELNELEYKITDARPDLRNINNRFNDLSHQLSDYGGRDIIPISPNGYEDSLKLKWEYPEDKISIDEPSQIDKQAKYLKDTGPRDGSKPPLKFTDDTTEAASPYANKGIRSRFQLTDEDKTYFNILRDRTLGKKNLSYEEKLSTIKDIDEMERILPEAREVDAVVFGVRDQVPEDREFSTDFRMYNTESVYPSYKNVQQKYIWLQDTLVDKGIWGGDTPWLDYRIGPGTEHFYPESKLKKLYPEETPPKPSKLDMEGLKKKYDE